MLIEMTQTLPLQMCLTLASVFSTKPVPPREGEDEGVGQLSSSEISFQPFNDPHLSWTHLNVSLQGDRAVI